MTRLHKHLRLAATLLGTSLVGSAAQACPADPFLGAICMMASNFCPRNFAEANGALLPIAQNIALFSLLGTNFGGNGITTFGLPDLRGRSAVGVGTGPGLTPLNDGQTGGAEQAALAVSNLPSHSHSAIGDLRGTAANGNTDNPTGAVPAKLPRSNIYSSGTATDVMGSSAITVSVGSTGSGSAFGIRSPYQAVRTCIALVGVYPPRN